MYQGLGIKKEKIFLEMNIFINLSNAVFHGAKLAQASNVVFTGQNSPKLYLTVLDIENMNQTIFSRHSKDRVSHYYIIVEMSVCLFVCLSVHDQFLTKINFQLFQDVFMVLGGKKIIKKNLEIFFLKIFIFRRGIGTFRFFFNPPPKKC